MRLPCCCRSIGPKVVNQRPANEPGTVVESDPSIDFTTFERGVLHCGRLAMTLPSSAHPHSTATGGKKAKQGRNEFRPRATRQPGSSPSREDSRRSVDSD